MAQQGPPPRRHGRHSAPDPEAGQQSADPYAADPYGRPADPYAPRDPYPPRDDDPQAPRGDSYGPRDDPYPPHDPYAADPRRADPSSADPYSADPYGADPRGADPYGADPYRARQAAAAPPQAPPRPAPPRQAPPPPAPQRQAPQRQAAPAPAPARRGASPWAEGDGADEADLPPWAGLTVRPARAAGTRTRAPQAEPEVAEPEAAPAGAPEPRRRGIRRGRAAAARLRKSRRRVYVYCGTAVVLAVAVAAFLAIRALPKHHPAPTFITTLQPGEFATVPAACNSVSPALLGSYLPGHVTKVNPAGTSASYSQCSFTVDTKPLFRVLNVTAQAYQPSAVAAGNGSATANAVDNFVIDEQTLRNPGKHSAVPPAQVTLITGLGTEGFRAVQVIHTHLAVNDVVTVAARQRNLVVTVTLQAQASGNGYGPVDVGTIEAGALAVARAVLTQDSAHAATG
ncbi:MAG TPA: hypothetical protein VGM79_20100 [Streptosporangiaceae bacterium]